MTQPINWLICLGLLCLTSFVHAQPAVENCHTMATFSLYGFGTGSASGECYLWPESDSTVDIYYPREWGLRMAPHRQARLQATKEAIAQAMTTYREQGFEDGTPLVHITAGYSLNRSPAHPESEQVQAITFPNPRHDGTCVMVIFHNQIRSLEELKFVVAHEVFHCIQQNSYRQQYNVGSYWWQEGSAEFAANIVYPTGNQEFSHTRAYRQQQELFNQGRGFPSALFFQSYYNQNGPRQLARVLSLMPDTHDAAVQYAVLTTISEFEHDFHQFAEQFIEKKISDSGGGFTAQPSVYYSQHGIITGSTTTELSVGNYIVGAYRYDLQAGSRYILNDLRTDPLPKLSFRQNAGAWQGLPMNSEIIIEDTCDAPVSLEFAITAVSSKPNIFMANLSFRAEECDDPEPSPCENTEALPACVQGQWELTLADLPQDSLPTTGNFGLNPARLDELYEYFFYSLQVNPDGSYSESVRQRTSKSGPGFNGLEGDTVTLKSEINASSSGHVCMTNNGLLFKGEQHVQHNQVMESSRSGEQRNHRDYAPSPIATLHEYHCLEDRRLPPFPFPANINVLQERLRTLSN